MKKIILFFLLISSFSVRAQVLGMREQSAVIDEILAERINTLLPSLMQKRRKPLKILWTR